MTRAAVTITCLLTLLAAATVGMAVGQGDCDPGAGGATLSAGARASIPAPIARIYLAQARRWDIDAAFLAAIGAQETDHGLNPNTRRVNGSGCAGLMQIGVGGRCGNFWGRWRCDGNHDGSTDVFQAADNVCAAARGLRGEKSAPPAGGPRDQYRQAACNYYGACADANANYAAEVLARADTYGLGTTTTLAASTVDSGCEEPAASFASHTSGSGRWRLAPGANRPGAELSAAMRAFMDALAARVDRELVVCTATNHSPTTSDGNPSDHWNGNAADICSSQNGFPASGGGYGDTIAASALITAGMPTERAREAASRGGDWTLQHAGYRIQILWRTTVGGNHHDHIHIGLKPDPQGALTSGSRA